MSYSDKVKAAVFNTHEESIAYKIIDMMQDLRLKNDKNTACRWIWELIQNAKDVVNNSGMVNIEINFDKKERYLSFKHDGKSFTTDNIVHLISQVSSKERNQSPDNGVTGKFGTGFLTTHLLSQKVIVDAFLQDEDEPIKKINILLDRSGETKEEVIAAVNESFRQLTNSQVIDVADLDKNRGFNTNFSYELDDRGIEIAKNGLKSFYASIPYVFAFVDKINSIKINDFLYIARGEKHTSENMETQTIHISENESKHKICIFLYRKEKIDLALPIIVKDREVFIDEYPENVPKLFCDFPLIGTEDFSFPVIVNSSYFNPNDPRSGIYLTDIDDKVVNENKNLMVDALNAYGELLDYVASHRWKHVYNIVCISRQTHKDWLSKEWFKNNIVEKCKEHIKLSEIIDTESGERKAIFDILDNQEIYIIGDLENDIREQVWELAKYIYPDYIVPFLEIHQWYSSLWPECRNLNVQKLINDVEEFECLETLESNLDGSISVVTWLNRLYKLLDSLQKMDYKSYMIYPNQLGGFCNINNLYVDDDIEDTYKQILSLLGNECRERLLNIEIQLPDSMACEIYDYDMLFEDILESINNSSFMEQEAMANLIVLYDAETKDDNEQLELLYLLKALFSEQIPDRCKVKRINSDVMKKVREYWCDEMADLISQCGNVDILANHLNLSDGKNVWVWLKEFIEYLEKYKHKNLFERKTKPILPNQCGEFITIDAIFLDSGEIDDIFKDILSETGNDIRSILLPVEIYLELPDSRVKGLGDVVQGVTEYVKEKQGLSKNQDEAVQNYFNKLFCWITDNPDKAQMFFKEIVENKHWLYNDKEIAINMKKAEKYDDLLAKYNIQDTKALEKALKAYSQEKDKIIEEETEISEALMIQYGISSLEEFVKAKELNIFKENFVHISESDQNKFEYVKRILERSKKAIFNHLASLPEYDVSDPIEVMNTIYIIKKNGKEIALITRPSDYGQVILYYGAEKDILDFEKEYELWVEDGTTPPQQITFGKMLKLTGINRIPLREVK